ncbi:MAG TPA: hypothetical protein VFE16_13965 [Candidatus Cybelea sp.]|jgi:hypothetical protein|nr:hypothetical protein [Candidatus Cybelea sp.]
MNVLRRGLARRRALVAALALCNGLVPSVGQAAVRAAHANAVTSDRDPRVVIRLPTSAQYVGEEKWVLFGIADCQLFAFVEANARRTIQRLFWVQFEGYIPSMPRLHHEYTSKRHATVGGLDFYVDTWLQTNDPHGPPPPNLKPLEAFIASKGYAVPAAIHSGSDEQHIDALLAAHGYALPKEALSVRLVHLTDVTNRRELMIIYTENLASTHLTVNQLGPGGTRQNLLPRIEEALIRRAENSIFIEPI